jgi:magnesium transporter
MIWHDVSDPHRPELDEVAATYSLHPLHIEDCRQTGRRAKVEAGDGYLLVSLKLLSLEAEDRLAVSDPAPLLEPLLAMQNELRSDEVLYRVLDAVAESYLALAEKLEDAVEALKSQVMDLPRPDVLEHIGRLRSTILHFRRVVNVTRHIAFQARHVPNTIVTPNLSPFLRDTHDDLAVILDLIAGERDRLATILDVYLSTVANRTTEAMRTLTLLSTVALPALVITSLFGMNIEYPSWTRSPAMFTGVFVLTVAITLLLLWYLKRNDYLPGGTTAEERRPDRARGHPRK